MTMKVLMFGWEFPPHITGGLGTACYGITKGLAAFGTEVIFVVPKAYGDEDQNFVSIRNASDVVITEKDLQQTTLWKNFRYIEVGSRIIPYLDPEDFTKVYESAVPELKFTENFLNKQFHFSGSYGPSLYDEVSNYALIAGQIAANNDFDVIHAHDWLTYFAGVAAKKVSGKPLVVHVHATEFDRSGEHVNQRVYDIERAGMQAADKIIAVSNLTRNIIINRYGIDPQKVVTVHNSVEPVNIPEITVRKGFKEKVVTFLGRITFQKGPDYFIEAAKKVIDRDPDVRFVMAGSGDMLNKMIRRVAKLGIATKFHFAGFLKGNEVYEMFAMSDVYVLPSVSEPFGISPLEAMMSDVPVVISKQSGVAEVLKHAIKVDFWDVDALADSIYGMLHYPALSKMFKKFGKQEVINLRWENSAFNINEVYKSVLKK